MIVIKRGYNKTCFRLLNGKVITLEGTPKGYPPVLNTINDNDWEQCLVEYGEFIKPRIVSDSNPDSVFIVSKSESYTKGQSEELKEEFNDNTAPITEDEAIKETPTKKKTTRAKKAE